MFFIKKKEILESLDEHEIKSLKYLIAIGRKDCTQECFSDKLFLDYLSLAEKKLIRIENYNSLWIFTCPLCTAMLAKMIFNKEKKDE